MANNHCDEQAYWVWPKRNFNHYQKQDSFFLNGIPPAIWWTELPGRRKQGKDLYRSGYYVYFCQFDFGYCIKCFLYAAKQCVELTIYVLLPLPILIVIIYFVNSNIHKKSEQIQVSLSDLTPHAQESYSGIRWLNPLYKKVLCSNFSPVAVKSIAKCHCIGEGRNHLFSFYHVAYWPEHLLTIMIGGLYYINNQHGVTLGTIVEFIVYVNMLTFPVSANGLPPAWFKGIGFCKKVKMSS